MAARLLWPLASRVQRRRPSWWSASRIVSSSYSTTGSRFVDWLQASAQRVEGQRIGVRRRALLLEQAAEDAQLGGAEVVHARAAYADRRDSAALPRPASRDRHEATRGAPATRPRRASTANEQRARGRARAPASGIADAAPTSRRPPRQPHGAVHRDHRADDARGERRERPRPVVDRHVGRDQEQHAEGDAARRRRRRPPYGARSAAAGRTARRRAGGCGRPAAGSGTA